MAVLVDTPRWPAHGTVFGHLVSDSSLWELHALARRIGLDPRAFDHDHYDLPAALLADAVAAGAELVDERELVRRLRAAGLRILPAQHAPRRGRALARLRQRCTPLLPPSLLEPVLERYREPSRRYHDLRHLDEMLTAQDLLAAESGEVPGDAQVLATLFHDAVYDGVAGQDERASAALAGQVLHRAGLPSSLVVEVQRLVLLTIEHRAAPGDVTGGRLVDADMAILGSAPGRYHVSVRDLRLEYHALSEAAWRAGRRAVLDGFLAAGDQLYATEQGRRRWLATARQNITDELAHLDG